MEGTPDEIIPRMRHGISRIIRDNEDRMEGSMLILNERLEGRSVSSGTEKAKHHSSLTFQNVSLTNQSSDTKGVQPAPSIHSGLGKPV